MEGSSKIGAAGGRVAAFGPFRYDVAAGRLMRGDIELALPPRGHAVLTVLLERAGTLVDKPTLLASAWMGTAVTEQSLSEAVRLVRRALADGDGPQAYVQTVPRRGYRFVAPVTWEPGRTLQPGTPGPAPQRPRRAWSPAALAASLIALLTIAWLTLVMPDRARVPPRARFTLDVGDLGRLHLKGQPSIAISPDGARLAVVLERDGVRRIALRTLQEGRARLLPGTEGAVAPFFSPDGAALAFFAAGRLKSIALTTGGIADLAAAPDPHGGAWARNGIIVFASAGRLLRLDPRAPGTLHEIAARSDWSWRWPDALSDGRLIATRWRGSLDASDVAVIDRSGTVARLLGGASHARAAGARDIYFARDGRLLSRTVDSADAAAESVADRLATDPFSGAAQFAASSAGVLVYASGEPEAVAERELHWLRDDGGAAVAFGPARVKTVRLAPDGERFAVTLADGAATDVWIAGPEPRDLRRLSHDGRSTGGVWAPDGLHVAFAQRLGDRFAVMVAPAAGGAARLLHSAGESAFPYSWAPSGRAIAIETYREGTGWDVDLVSVDREARRTGVQAHLASRADERFPRFSPAGGWLAYQSNASGQWDVYVLPAEGGAPRRVSREGGESPIWHGESRLLYTADGLLWSVDLDAPDSARPLLPLRERIVADASGERVLALARPAGEPGPGLHVVLGIAGR